MDEKTAGRDPFFRVYRTIRGELARGKRLPGSHIRVDETARAIGISPTPVREALAMLAGERLVHGCRRQGYFVPKPSASELAQLYTLSEMHLLTAIRLHGTRIEGESPKPPEDEERAEGGTIARVFITILARAELPMLLDAGALILERLTSARMAEDPELGRRAMEEIVPLLEEGRRGALAQAVRAYHRVRRAKSPELAEAIAASARTADAYIPDMV